MISPALTRRDAGRKPRPRAVRPEVESLEDRQLLSTMNGGKWAYGSRITYSFVPDGTSIGGIPSNLFQTLNGKFTTAAWTQAIQKAAAVWQQVAGINFALVPDDGSPIGGTGPQQGDNRYGDIRIGAYPQESGQLALACSPPPINGGSDAGDIFFNSQAAWKINNDFDLQTVAIHELGHALGLGHSALQSADLYAKYTSMKQTLTADDSNGIQAVYGGVAADKVDNNSASTALDLTPALNSVGQASATGQTITSISDVDWFKVTVPSTTSGTLVVTMQSTALSSLSPRLAVLTGSQAVLGQSLAMNVYGATVSFTVKNVSPGQVYYFRTAAANNGPGSNGAYGLQVNLGSAPQAAIAPPYTTVAQQPSQGNKVTNAETANGSSGGLLGRGIGLGLNLGSVLGLGLSLNSSDGLSVDAELLGIDVGVKLQIGTLSVWAESLEADKPRGTRASRRPAPRPRLGQHGQVRIYNGHFTNPSLPRPRYPASI
jgi:hypothetical protein